VYQSPFLSRHEYREEENFEVNPVLTCSVKGDFPMVFDFSVWPEAARVVVEPIASIWK
jgi:hypothetical protein